MCCTFVYYVILQCIWATITVFLPSAFPCKPLVCPSLDPAQNLSAIPVAQLTNTNRLV